MSYTVWLEFEKYVDTDTKAPDDGYCNIQVTFENGSQLAYNVWTVDFYRQNIQTIFDTVTECGCAVFPDLIVSKLEREHIEEVLKRILVQ